MNPAISPPTSRTQFTASRPLDYSGKSWEPSSFRLSDSIQEELQAIPKTEPICNAISEQIEMNVDSHHEVTSRLRGSSRHRAPSSAGGSQHSIRPSKHPSQKAMLSKALQKANTAVLLDNAQNFEVAKQAYSEACALLERVMSRSSGDDDRKKLENIRNTYTSRITEIDKISSPIGSHGKALPARPDFGIRMSNGSNQMDPYDEEEEEDDDDDEEEEEDKEYASSTMQAPIITNDQNFSAHQRRSLLTSQLPPRRESLHQQSLDTALRKTGLITGRSQRKVSKDLTKDRDTSDESHLVLSKYSPKRSLSPNKPVDFSSQQNYSLMEDFGSNISHISYLEGHSRMLSGDSLSWLDTIDESGRSATPSIHSRTSSVKFPRKMGHATSSGADAEFDAALDAAVEAAYDESFILPEDFRENDIAASLAYGDEQTSQNLLLSDSEDIEQLNHHVERISLTRPQQSDFVDDQDLDYFDEDEQMLEEITKDYIMDDFEFGLQSKSTLPRESDSSGFSGRTWASSIVSNPTTASTIISTTSRARTPSQAPFLKLNIPSQDLPSPSLPPPHQDLPSSPSPKFYSNQNLPLEPISPGTQNRRYSSYNYNQSPLENDTNSTTEFIEISSMNQARSLNFGDSTQSKLEESIQTRPQKSNSSHRPPMLQLPIKEMSSSEETSSSDLLPGLSSFPLLSTSNDTTESHNYQFGFSAPSTSKTSLRKNFSSSSLRNLRKRNVTVPNHEGASDISLGTPINTPHHGRIDEGTMQLAMPNLPTPVSMSSREKLTKSQLGSVYLLNTDIQNPDNLPLLSPDGKSPISLEPCPNECFLRPFWLMRALYYTITHPKGGYLSNRLFVPSDAWRVKGVKLKNIEDKISNCDMVTAALLKISRIDSLDVDAILDEMQKLEDIIEQVQISLAKKLGNEVGPTPGSSGGQRESVIEGDSENNSNTTKPGSTSVKSSFSWRRLRSKNSGVGLSQNYSSKQSNTEGKKHDFKMASLPMTSNSTMKIRFNRRDLSQINFIGPNANYMSALARLFDAAQVIDQIARQIEDPGLRRAHKTIVGLELSARHAAEFFSSYICRFVLSDVGLLLDKFVKKGGEWVLE